MIKNPEKERQIVALFDAFNHALTENDLPNAKSNLEKARSVLSTYPSTNELWAYYYLNLATYYNNSGKPDETEKALSLAQDVIKHSKNIFLEAKLLESSATNASNRGHYLLAVELIERAIKKQFILKDKIAIARLKVDLGKLLLRTETNWEEPIKIISEGQKIAKEISDVKLEIMALHGLGKVFHMHRFLFLAIDHFRNAEYLARKIKHHALINTSVYLTARTYTSIRDVKLLKQQIDLVSVTCTEDPIMPFYVDNLKICLANQEGQFEDALRIAKNQLQYKMVMESDVLKIESLLAVANVYFNLRDFDASKKYGQEAKKLAERTHNLILTNEINQLFNTINFWETTKR